MSHIVFDVRTGKETVVQQDLPAFPEQKTLGEKRNDASMSRVDFCKALWRQGLMPKNEAVQAARGEWPATFAGFTAGLSADAAADAQIEWAGSMTIRYVAPTLQALALVHAGGDQAQANAILDQLFGIS